MPECIGMHPDPRGHTTYLAIVKRVYIIDMQLLFSFLYRPLPSICALLLCVAVPVVCSADLTGMAFIDQQIHQHKDKTGVLVLDKGEEALLARAWLADHAKRSIQVQYFIWSTDNIGILATEALLRAVV